MEDVKPRRRKPRGGQKNLDMLMTDFLHDETFDENYYDAAFREERDLERVNRRRKRNKRPRRVELDA